MNYDSSSQVVRWLIDRPETDRAAVLALYWNLDADYLFRFVESDFDEEDYRLEDWRFSRLTEARYVTGFYPQGVVYFNPHRHAGACPGGYTSDTKRKYTPPRILVTVEDTEEYVDVEIKPMILPIMMTVCRRMWRMPYGRCMTRNSA